MIRQLCAGLLGIACVATSLLVADEKPATKEHELRDLKLTVPTTWKYVEPSNQFRVGSFEIPAVEGDEEPSELAVTTFAGGGGGVRANIDRWIGQFDADGREVKVTTGQSPQGPYVLVDITGTYNMTIGPPIQRKTKKVEDARLLAAILQINEQDNYFLKFGGPHATIDANAKAFRAAFGADSEKEKNIEVKPAADAEKSE